MKDKHAYESILTRIIKLEQELRYLTAFNKNGWDSERIKIEFDLLITAKSWYEKLRTYAPDLLEEL